MALQGVVALDPRHCVTQVTTWSRPGRIWERRRTFVRLTAVDGSLQLPGTGIAPGLTIRWIHAAEDLTLTCTDLPRSWSTPAAFQGAIAVRGELAQGQLPRRDVQGVLRIIESTEQFVLMALTAQAALLPHPSQAPSGPAPIVAAPRLRLEIAMEFSR